jgi:hypothetical protein
LLALFFNQDEGEKENEDNDNTRNKYFNSFVCSESKSKTKTVKNVTSKKANIDKWMVISRPN